MTMRDPWQVLDTTELLDRRPWLRVVADHVRLPNGVEIPDFYRVEALEFVKVFAVCEDGRVPLVQHYKHGPRMVSTELPAGYIEAGETPLVAAQRELLEETGLQAADWQELGAFVKDGNRGCGFCHAFLARDAIQVAQPDPGDLQDQTLHFYDLAQLRDFWLNECCEISTTAVIGLALARLG